MINGITAPIIILSKMGSTYNAMNEQAKLIHRLLSRDITEKDLHILYELGYQIEITETSTSLFSPPK